MSDVVPTESVSREEKAALLVRRGWRRLANKRWVSPDDSFTCTLNEAFRRALRS
jgi:hypothetical protein